MYENICISRESNPELSHYIIMDYTITSTTKKADLLHAPAGVKPGLGVTPGTGASKHNFRGYC